MVTWMEATRNNRPWVGWYKKASWKKLRLWQLQREPLCRFCKKKGIITPATVCDHRTPHKGNIDLFFDKGNLQSLCKFCHDGTKQKIEKSGEFGCDENGIIPAWQS